MARILLAVYNQIEYDGRVQRAAEAACELGDVEVISLAPKNSAESHDGTARYRNVRVPMASNRLIGHLRFWTRLVVHATVRKPDVIHAHDYYLALPGWIASRLSGAKFIYDAHELLVEEDGTVRTKRRRFWATLEKAATRRAHAIIAANMHRAKIMRRVYDLGTEPVVVENVPPKPASKYTTDEITRRYPALVRRTPTERLIVYQGDVGANRGIDRFVAAMPYLSDDHRLIIIGDGPALAHIRNVMNENNLHGRVHLLGKVPRDDLYDILRHCDAGIVTYGYDDINSIYCAPNKVYEYAHAGLPMVVTDQPPLVDIASTYGIAVIVRREFAASQIAAALAGAANCLDCRERLVAFTTANEWHREREKLLDTLRRAVAEA